MAPDYESLDARLAEFWDNVWIHTEDAFLQQFDTATDIEDDVLEALLVLIGLIARGAEEEQLAERVRDRVDETGEPLLVKIMQIVGLTRSKIVTDVEALARVEGLTEARPSSYRVIPRRPEHWALASRELARRPIAVFGPSVTLPEDQRDGVIETVNRATWPGWIRQEKAKRSGHQAEARLARICAAVQVPFAPREKAEQDIAADVSVNGESFDLVFPNADTPRACVTATTHTANIGQFGESKDAGDIIRAKEALAALDPQPKLIALADGLGYRGNQAGLRGVLDTADEFCQFRTIWKAVVVGAEAGGVIVNLWVPDPTSFAGFLTRYGDAVNRVDERPDEGVTAGDGVFSTD